MDKIEIGDEAEDRITGFRGIVVCESLWLHGCRRLSIQPQKMKDGKPVDICTFDEPQVKLIKKSKVGKGSQETGGPRPEPMRR